MLSPIQSMLAGVPAALLKGRTAVFSAESGIEPTDSASTAPRYSRIFTVYSLAALDPAAGLSHPGRLGKFSRVFRRCHTVFFGCLEALDRERVPSAVGPLDEAFASQVP